MIAINVLLFIILNPVLSICMVYDPFYESFYWASIAAELALNDKHHDTASFLVLVEQLPSSIPCEILCSIFCLPLFPSEHSFRPYTIYSPFSFNQLVIIHALNSFLLFLKFFLSLNELTCYTVDLWTTGLNCTGPLICRLFFSQYYWKYFWIFGPIWKNSRQTV